MMSKLGLPRVLVKEQIDYSYSILKVIHNPERNTARIEVLSSQESEGGYRRGRPFAGDMRVDRSGIESTTAHEYSIY